MKNKLVLWALAALVFTGCQDYAAGESGSAPSRYTVVFDSQGGSAVSPVSADEGTAVAKPADPARTGYSFLGWFSAASGGTLYTWPHSLTGNVTMYARWQAGSTPPQYTLTFDSRGGSAVPPVTADGGTAVPKPADPARAGYSFLGWFSAAAGGALYTWPHTLTGSLTMYARWILNSAATLTLSIDDFTGLTDPAQGAFTGAAFTLTRPNGTKTVTVTGGGMEITWYLGLAKIAQGNTVTLDLAVLNLNPGLHTLRVTAKYGGVLYSKEITFTVN
jgi:uncharacterized repeat protein (TIGR02543 family)